MPTTVYIVQDDDRFHDVITIEYEKFYICNYLILFVKIYFW